jgi:hypothetical protein
MSAMIKLSQKNGGIPVLINVSTITAVFASTIGKLECTVVRTTDGNETLVRESVAEIEAMFNAQADGPAPAMRLETKGGKKGESGK